MPLPVRSTSVRSTNTDARLSVPRTTQNAQTRKTQPLRATKLANEVKSATTEPTESSIDGSETSSRIPSPFKRETLTENATKPRAEIARPTQRPLGHSRQRSTAVPTIESRPKFGHSRSISTVSTNTTATSHTTHTADTSSTSGSDHLRASTARPKAGGTARLLGLSTRQKHETSSRIGTPSSATSRSLNFSLVGDQLQSELLQLAIVHDESSRSLQIYQSAIDKSLASSRAELKAIRDDVTEKQQAFYHASNLEAVNIWLQEYGYQGTCQLVQNFSVAVRDLSNLEHIFGGDDGLAATFHMWERSMAANASLGGDDDDVRIHLEFIQHLSPELKRFKQQIASVQRIFSNLPLNTSESAVATVLKLHISLANILHQQSQIMLLIGEALVSDRNRWINSEVMKAMSDYTDSGEQRRIASFLG